MSARFASPVPYRVAIAHLQRQGMLPADLSARQLAKIGAEIRRVSEFSARVTDEHFLQQVHDVVGKIVDPSLTGREPGSYMDRPTARAELRDYLRQIGYTPDPGAEGSIRDLLTDGRLNLIIETRTQMAQGHARHVQSNSRGALAAFPAQELYRLSSRAVPRDWRRRWVEAGGSLYNERMIARKDDPVWTAISTFGNPYPPFDYNSGMWVRAVPRREAIELGVIEPDTAVEPTPVAMAEELTAGTAGHSPALVEAAAESLQAKGIPAVVREGRLEVPRA